MNRQRVEEEEEEEDAADVPLTKEEVLERRIKRGILGFLALIVVYIILDYSIPDLGYLNAGIVGFLRWVEDNPWEGMLVFALVYAVATVMFVPGSLLTLGAGFVFARALGFAVGLAVGVLAVFVGAYTGALLAFTLGRYVLQDKAQQWFDKFKIMKAIDKALETQGLKLMFLLRLSPALPFNAFNYVVALTRVRFVDYAIGTAGILPGTIAYVFIGASTSGLLGNDDDETGGGNKKSAETVRFIVLIGGAIVTFLGVIAISYFAKKALNEALEAAEDEEASDGSAAADTDRALEMERGMDAGVISEPEVPAN